MDVNAEMLYRIAKVPASHKWSKKQINAGCHMVVMQYNWTADLTTILATDSFIAVMATIEGCHIPTGKVLVMLDSNKLVESAPAGRLLKRQPLSRYAIKFSEDFSNTVRWPDILVSFLFSNRRNDTTESLLLDNKRISAALAIFRSFGMDKPEYIIEKRCLRMIGINDGTGQFIKVEIVIQCSSKN